MMEDNKPTESEKPVEGAKPAKVKSTKKATKKSAAKKKPGRPKGAKTKKRTEGTGVEYPARCPSCASTTSKVLNFCSVSPVGGVLPTGESYTEVVFRRVECVECGQRYIRKTYVNKPSVDL